MSSNLARASSVGILCIVAAFACFSTQDMLFKLLSPYYSIPAVHLLRISFSVTITMLVLVPIEHGRRQPRDETATDKAAPGASRLTPWRGLASRRPWLHLLRGLFIFTANMCFFTGLAILDISLHVAIFFIAPLLVTGLSVVVLGEHVGWRRWSAVVLGLVGAALIIKPLPQDFNAFLLLPLAAAILHAGTQLVTRVLGKTEPASVLSIYGQSGWMIMAVPLFLVLSQGAFEPSSAESPWFPLLRAWSLPQPQHYIIFAAIIVLSTIAGFLVGQGYRMIPASTAAQYEYVALPMGVLWGLLIWQETIDLYSWVGIGMIGGAGLYVFYRERIKQSALPLALELQNEHQRR